jgi:hypothetical protein
MLAEPNPGDCIFRAVDWDHSWEVGAFRSLRATIATQPHFPVEAVYRFELKNENSELPASDNFLGRNWSDRKVACGGHAETLRHRGGGRAVRVARLRSLNGTGSRVWQRSGCA